MGQSLTRGPAKPYASKPSIDWSHPLAKDLVSYLYDLGHGAIIDLVSGKLATGLTGTANPIAGATSPIGVGTKYAGTNNSCDGMQSAFNARSASLTAAAPFSISVGMYGVIGANTGGTIFTLQDTTNTSGYNINGFSSGVTQFVVQTPGGAHVTAANTFPANSYQTVSFNADTGSTGRIYCAGKQDGSSFTNTTTTATTTQQVAINAQFLNNAGGSGSGSGALNGFVPYVALWTRAKTAAEELQLHHDPYCFLIYPEDEMFATLVGVVSGGTAVTTDFGGIFEFLSSLRTDTGAQAEYLTSVRADWPAQSETVAAVRCDGAGLPEFVAGLNVSVPSPIESIGSMRADQAALTETTGALRSDAAAFVELVSGVRLDAGLGAETLSSLRADQAAQLESTTALRADQAGSAEALVGVVRQAPAATETLAGVQSSAAVEVENLGAVAVVGNAAVQLEAVGTVNSSQLAAPETTTAMRSDATGAAEALVSVSRHAGAAVENVAGVRSDAATAQENSGALAVTASAGAPIEILASTRTDASGSVETVAKMQASTTGLAETTAALTSNLPAPLENTFGVKRDSAIQEEVQGGVSVVAGSAVQIEITSRFAAFSAAAIEIVQIAVSTVLRMLSASGVFTGETDLPPGQPQPFDPSVSPSYVDEPEQTYRNLTVNGVVKNG